MKRVIFLVDMNAFFISCEKTRHPEIEGKPAAVAGDPVNRSGIILTANYEARKYGIKTTMILREAFRLCPDLIIIPPDHKFYEMKSKEVMEILSDYTPVIEQNSIDEAWLDMTGSESLFGQPLEAAGNIMDRIKNELDLWCSIGISENKFLAKMASEMKKPLGITELWKKDIEEKMWPLPVSLMYGVGKQTAKKLNSMGIYTIKDLALTKIDNIYKKLGKTGVELVRLARGIDDSPVNATREEVKSIGRSTTLAHDITDIEDAKAILMDLADDLGMSARKSGKKGNTVQITIKYSNFNTITRQMTISPTCNIKDIYGAGVRLLEKNWTGEPVRLLGISLSGFQNEREQISLFDLDVDEKEIKTDKKIDSLEDAILKIRKKYGTDIIKPGITHKKE
ncbi:MAG: DNA polymerase IV [Bacillota bacterium]|jgi:DNA polymerase-4|nr:DNA polymerase IV [Bacillota bacterium]NLL59244.1 DNA polymerase IV [Tissierellia bacterium]